jgi:microcystin-dependent protein
MAVTYIDHAGTQGQTDFTFTFPYLEDEHIKVEIDGVDTTDFTVVATPTAKIVLDTGLSAAAAVRVRRRSAPNENLVDFVNGSVLTEAELDLSYRHNRYLAEEIAELNDQSLQIENGGTEWDAKTKRIKNVGTAVDSTDAVTKVYLDNKVAQVSTGATQPPLKWVFSAISGTNNTYTVTGAEVLGDTAYEVSIDGLIKEPTVEYTVDPSTDTLTIIPNMTGSEDIVVIQRGFGVAIAGTVGTNSLVDGSVTNAKLASGAVTSDKISTTDTNFNVQSGGNVGIGTNTPSVKLAVNGSIETLKDRQSGTPEGGQLILRSQDPNGYRWNIDNFSFTNGTGGSLFRLFKSDELDSQNGVTYLTIDPTTGYVNIGTSGVATHALDVTGDLNITGDYKVNGTNLQTVPTGTVSAFAGSAAPTGYALCDGSAVNRTTQAALFGVIGTTYGIGDGSTTFNLPDLRGRVVAGFGESLLGATADTLGEDNGLIADTKEHTLTEAQMPSHTHSSGLSFASGTIQYPGVIGGGNKLVSSNTTATGGDESHNNVQPTIILNYIIKT